MVSSDRLASRKGHDLAGLSTRRPPPPLLETHVTGQPPRTVLSIVTRSAEARGRSHGHEAGHLRRGGREPDDLHLRPVRRIRSRDRGPLHGQNDGVHLYSGRPAWYSSSFLIFCDSRIERDRGYVFLERDGRALDRLGIFDWIRGSLKKDSRRSFIP